MCGVLLSVTPLVVQSWWGLLPYHHLPLHNIQYYKPGKLAPTSSLSNDFCSIRKEAFAFERGLGFKDASSVDCWKGPTQEGPI